MPISGSTKALMYALGGVLRGGAGRGNYTSARVFVSIGGVQYATGRAAAANAVLVDSLSITQNLDDIPDTCTFKVRGAHPSPGTEVAVTLGSRNNLDRLFHGIVMAPSTEALLTKPISTLDTVNCVDWTWFLTRHKINKRYTNTSATAIAIDIMVGAPVSFTTYGVEANLPVLDEFTITNETRMDALRRLAKRVGAYFDVSAHGSFYKDIKLSTVDASGTNPVSLTQSHKTLEEFTFTRDMGQMVTRAIVEGGGVNAIAACVPGETILPVQDVSWYNRGGGFVACGPQRIVYAKAIAGGSGSLVGPGTSPAAAPVAMPAGGSGVESGAHLYAVTFVTGSGESLPSPTASVTLGGSIGDPTDAPVGGLIPSPNPSGPYPFNSGENERWWAYTFVTAGGETLPSPLLVPISGPLGLGGPWFMRMSVPTGPTGVTDRKIYRTVAGGAQLKLVGAIGNNTTAIFEDHIFDGSLGANAPTSNTANVGNQTALSAIPIGGSGTTSRKIYRTVAGGAQLKLQSTIGDNTTTTATDSTADASLTTNAPTSDTSGLTQPTGQVLAGASSIVVAGPGAFDPSGGWAVIGNGQQVIRFTGVSGSSLTGIPVSGPGAITATVTYNSTITAAATLVGIPASGDGSIAYDILAGDPVNLVVIVDDAAAQAYIATVLIGGVEDGVVEEYIQDNRLSEAEAIDRGTALLALRSSLLETAQWKSRDLNTRAGRTQNVNMASPVSATADLKIQSVVISDFNTGSEPATAAANYKELPTFTASASDQRYSFEDLLRQLRGNGTT